MDTIDESLKGSGSVKATISIFDESMNVRKPEKNRNPFPAQEDAHAHEGKDFTEKERANAESELFRARGMAKELARQIEQANAKARSHRSEVQAMWKSGGRKKKEPEAFEVQESSKKYAEVVQELDNVKEQLRKLRSDVKSALDAKAKAERMVEVLSSKMSSNLHVLEKIKTEIDEANEEHVLVELARIEAERERKEIDARRGEEAGRFAKNMEDTRKKVKALRKELSRAKELKVKLAMTNSDVAVLQSEMEFVRAMERNNVKTDVVETTERMKEESESKANLQSAEDELKAAKKELATIKEESFQLMTAMDVTRDEITRLTEEINRLKGQEKKADSQVQHANSKLLKAKARMESATVADERAKAIVANLTAALQQLKTEIEVAKGEKELTEEETRCFKAETERIKLETTTTEDRMRLSVQELDLVKASEAAAVKKLKSMVEQTMKSRLSSVSQKSSTVTLSKFEFEYLTQHASLAQALADKKVAAAEAWIEALKAGEKEIKMRAEAVEREIKETRAMEEKKIFETDKSLADEKRLEEELTDLRQNEVDNEDLGMQHARPARKSVRESRASIALKRTKVRRVSTSSVTVNPRSPSFVVKKRTVIPNFVKLIRDRRVRRQN